MKKILFATAAVAMLFASSCKKDDDAGPSNSWTVGSKTYGASTVTATANTLYAGSGNGTTASSLSVTFNGSTVPTTGGDFTVVAGTPAANQISFSGADYDGTTVRSYTSTGAGSVKAKVSVNGGKVSVSMPTAEAQITGGGKLDVAINITQTN